jgi:hypothetical protein
VFKYSLALLYRSRRSCQTAARMRGKGIFPATSSCHGLAKRDTDCHLQSPDARHKKF